MGAAVAEGPEPGLDGAANGKPVARETAVRGRGGERFDSINAPADNM
jgi:hypothetical protein